MAITSPGAIFISLNEAFKAESGAPATFGGDATAGPMNWADAATPAKLNAGKTSNKLRTSLFIQVFITSLQSPHRFGQN
jgi:hypothetical protein